MYVIDDPASTLDYLYTLESSGGNIHSLIFSDYNSKLVICAYLANFRIMVSIRDGATFSNIVAEKSYDPMPGYSVSGT